MRASGSFIGQPIKSIQTMLRVLSEYDSDYIRIIPDGIYGPDTVSAVSHFQKKHALPVTGIVNQETWETIVDFYDAASAETSAPQTLDICWGGNVAKGRSDPNIGLVQCMLRQLAECYSSIGSTEVCGVMDDATCDAIASFQLLCGIPMNGILDKLTWKNLALQYPLSTQPTVKMRQDRK